MVVPSPGEGAADDRQGDGDHGQVELERTQSRGTDPQHQRIFRDEERKAPHQWGTQEVRPEAHSPGTRRFLRTESPHEAWNAPGPLPTLTTNVIPLTPPPSPVSDPKDHSA